MRKKENAGHAGKCRDYCSTEQNLKALPLEKLPSTFKLSSFQALRLERLPLQLLSNIAKCESI